VLAGITVAGRFAVHDSILPPASTACCHYAPRAGRLCCPMTALFLKQPLLKAHGCCVYRLLKCVRRWLKCRREPVALVGKREMTAIPWSDA